MTATLVLPDTLAAELRAATAIPMETAAVLLVSVTGTASSGWRLLGRELHWVPDGAYLRREHDGLTIASDGYVPALGRAAEIGAAAIWFHTHPGNGSSSTPSKHDRIVDEQLADLFRLRTESDYYGALIIALDEGQLSFTGHLCTENAEASIQRLWVVGDRLAMISAANTIDARPVPGIFDRNVRAFGGEIQRVLSDLRIALVGCGGTGSAVAEQLVRLGVRQLVLVDPDILSESNITRVYGATPADVGRSKPHVLAAHLSRVAPDATLIPIQSMVTVEATARELTSCDIVFGCTDDNAGRLVLSRLASYYLIPVIDSGVLLSSDRCDRLTGIDGRVTVLTPGTACLVCRSRVDLQRAMAELLTPDERRRREDEGYAPALAGVEPAVVAYTTLVAAVAVSELLERLIGYGSEPVPSEILVRCHDREFSINLATPRGGHYCDPSAGKLGLGDTVPLLEQTWTA